MKTNLFYFSATGNSLSIARELAAKLSETQIYAIPRAMKGAIDLEADCIGLIFPVFFCGMPRIVIKFIEALDAKSPRFYFAVCSGGAPFPVGTLSQTQRKLRQNGLSLHAGFYIQMPGNYLVKYEAFSEDAQKTLFTQAKVKIETISTIVKARARAQQDYPIEKNNFLINWIGESISQSMLPKYPTLDQNFWTHERCVGCKLCEQICPVQNIRFINGRPKWEGHCEHCLACIQWCPVEAIEYQKRTEGRKRYHHPEVSAKELYKI